MARTGLGALTGGYMEGSEFADKRKRDKQVRELLGRENVRLKNESKALDEFDPEGEFDFETYEPPQTWLEKVWGRITGAQPAAAAQAIQPPQTPQQPQAIQAQQPPTTAAPEIRPFTFVDGGAVRHMRKAYAHGGKVKEEEDEQEYKSEWYEPLQDVGRSAKNLVKGALQNTRRTARQADRDIAERWSDVTKSGLTTAERGRETREFVGEGIKGGLAIGVGLAEDTGVPRAIRGAGKFIGGVLGYGLDDKVAAIRALPEEGSPERPGGVAPPTEPSAQSTQAIQTDAPPTNTQEPAEEEIDFSTEARQIMPEDLGAHSSKDWERERNYWAAYAVTQGRDPFEAMKKVDQQQASGFSRYAMQATTLMDADDMEGAARALYAAYQYFPNGKDVKFGIQQGKDGRRVIVAMGSDEKTGKPSGPPQIVNRDTISRMVENLQKPGALRAWTTDWQATESKLWEQGFKQDQLKETKQHNRAMEAVGMARAEAEGRSGGLKETTKLTAARDFRESMELFGFAGEEESKAARFLTGIMGQLYIMGHANRESSTIISDVQLQHESGNLIPWLKSLGIDVDAE